VQSIRLSQADRGVAAIASASGKQPQSRLCRPRPSAPMRPDRSRLRP
jgi:hypothetical protein